MMANDKNSVVMVGAFPPPLHGMAAVNAAVRDALEQAGATPTVIDVAAPSLDRSVSARLARLPRAVRGLGKLAGKRGLRNPTLYTSVSGGVGQVYELIFVVLGRLRGMRLFLHHHSFAYLDAPGMLTWALIRVAGNDAAHLTQSAQMSNRLQLAYGTRRVAAISNAVFLMDKHLGCVAGREAVGVLGFISNIAQEKGVFDFLDLLAAAGNAGLPVRARLAGPFQDGTTERAVRERLGSLPQVEYVGPQYGADKDAFYAGIDVLIFPTRYENETEGIVNHEAMSRGIPVIAYGRGCIPEIVGPDCGLVIDPAEPFVPLALAKLQSWLADPAGFAAASRAAAARFSRTYEENQARWRALLAELSGSAVTSEPARATARGTK